MAEPGSEPSLRELAERLALAAIGAVALTGERAEALAEDLAEKGGLSTEQARESIDTLLGRWRGEASRAGDVAGRSLSSFFRELGLATRDEVEELELRLAQLEHRLRLVEDAPPAAPPALPPL